MTGTAFPDRADEIAADEIVTEVLLRCWVREAGVPPAPGARELRLPLPALGLTLEVALTYRSPTGWHRFGPPRLGAATLDAGLLAALLVREVSAGAGLPPAAGRTALGRLVDSARRIEQYIAFRRGEPAAEGTGSTERTGLTAVSGPTGVSAPVPAPFLAAERALVTGHPFHPAAKNRQEASEDELARYSPELDGAFPLHWFAAHPEIVRTGGPDPSALLRSLYDGPRAPAGHLPLPAHPWQARAAGIRPGLADLLADGRLVDLGPAGPPWFPTASLRTVWRPDAPVMLKLSLGMRITNSRRELHRAELALGAEMARFGEVALDGWLAAHHPAFRLIPEPAWAAVEPGGLECALRTNPFGAHDRAVCAAALVADRPDLSPDAPGRSRRSMLASLLTGLAGGSATTPVAVTWFERYLRVLIAPALDLYLCHGVGLEAHLQNTLVTLDEDGWPVAGWYRDSQGYYLAASRAAEARRALPGLGAGLPAVFDDALVEERIVYYAVVNNALAVIGALGAAGVADEDALLRRLRELLVGLRRRRGPHGPAGGRGLHSPPGPTRGPGLLERLLDAPTLPCKANLRTCVDGRDELAGPVATQSIYVEIPNPLVEVRP